MRFFSFAATILCAAAAHAAVLDAAILARAGTPVQIAQYGVRNYAAPVLVDGLHDPAGYQAAPRLPAWQFATSDPTGGALTFERERAPASGWHAWSRRGEVAVTGGGAATPDHVYTVFNGQQLVAALNDAGNAPKIVRVVGHIDLRWSKDNTVFREYTSYRDQKFGGSVAIPSNTTLVGINDAHGRPARITGTSILIGGELALAPDGDPRTDFKAWVAAGKDGDDYPTWTRNVILRNLVIDTPWDVNPEDAGNAYVDGITISRAQNVWIDHVTIGDGDTPDALASAPFKTRHDGALDIVRGSDYVTIANSLFNRHHKTTLVGNGDAGRAWSDEGRLHVSFYGNVWDGATTRLPLVRHGQVHIFNNLVAGSVRKNGKDSEFESATDARYHANVLLENNVYRIDGLKPGRFCGKVVKGKDLTGLRAAGNLLEGDGPVDAQCGLPAPPAAAAWSPPYPYTLQPADTVRAAVAANAGAGKLK